MQSLGAGPLGHEAEADEAPVDGGLGRGIVLPRVLRKPVRALLRREWRVPRYAGLKAMALLFASTAIAGVLIGEHVGTVTSAVTAWSGLAIDEVKISGQSETSEVDILERLGIGPLPSLVTFDVDAGRTAIEALPWVKEATIRKLYPDTLQVDVVERKPFAVWQHDGKVSLIDREGRIITDAIGDRYAALPMVVGPGAETRVVEFASMIRGFPTLKPRIRAGVLVQGRRWNIALKNGVEVFLPEVDPESAIVQLIAIDDASGLLTRDIAAVDLRLIDRMVVRLTDSGVAARAAMLKEREKMAKKGKANT